MYITCIYTLTLHTCTCMHCIYSYIIIYMYIAEVETRFDNCMVKCLDFGWSFMKYGWPVFAILYVITTMGDSQLPQN